MSSLPKISTGMASCILINPIISEIEILINEFEEIKEVSCLAKFCVYNPKQGKKKEIKHYTSIPIRINKENNSFDVGDVKVITDTRDLLAIAANCDLVAVIPNGPIAPNEKLIKTIVNNAASKHPYERCIFDNGNFYQFQEVMCYLGLSIIKHSYFWPSHERCMSIGHSYYKNIDHNTKALFSNNENIYDYSMNHELCFGLDGTALLRIFQMGSDHFDHFLGMVYSVCDGFDDEFRVAVTQLSTSHDTHPFKISTMGSRIIITRLYTHEHYLFEQYKDLIDSYRSGKVIIKTDDDE